MINLVVKKMCFSFKSQKCDLKLVLCKWATIIEKSNRGEWSM